MGKHGEPDTRAAANRTAGPGPSLRADRLITRHGLLRRLAGPAAPEILLISAPAGSGKSTLLAQLAEGEPGPVGWIGSPSHDVDAALLVEDLARDLAAALGPGPVADLAPGLHGTDSPRSVTRLVRAMAQEPVPALVILDDVHRFRDDPRCIDVVVSLVDQLPPGWRVAIAGRQSIALPVSRWLARDRALAQLDLDDLALDPHECGLVLHGMGLDVPDEVVADVHARTEGWPAGVYLSALALRSEGRRRSEQLVAGDDALIRSYLESEVLAGIADTDRELLRRTSIVPEVCGSLATALTGMSDAGERLHAISATLLLVRPVDRAERWYRFHALLGDLLQRQLEDHGVDVSSLHARASAWYEAEGDMNRAIEHAARAGDSEAVKRLVLANIQAEYRVGKTTTVRRWINLAAQGRDAWDPQLAIAAALIAALYGDTAATARAVAAAGAAGTEDLPEPPAGSEFDAYFLRALLCQHGPELMARDARRALDRHGDDWSYAPMAWVVLGSVHRMLGDDQAGLTAFATLEHTMDGGVSLARLFARAERAHAAMAHHDWAEAEAILQRDSRVVLDRLDPEGIAVALWLTADARFRAHRGDMRTAGERLNRAQLTRPHLSWAIPWLAVRSLTEMARAQLLIGDAGGARTSLAQAHEIVEARPRLGLLAGEVQEVRARVMRAGGSASGASTLSPAELRLLPFLQTHLTFKEIGERFTISPNTVKTEVLSIYGKLGATSRSEAVEAAIEAGLLEDPFA